MNSIVSDKDTTVQDLASKLLNVDDALERSNFPHMQLVLLQVYLYQASEYFNSPTISNVADKIGKAMIAYRTGQEGGRMNAITGILKQTPEMVQVPTQQQPVGRLRQIAEKIAQKDEGL